MLEVKLTQYHREHHYSIQMHYTIYYAMFPMNLNQVYLSSLDYSYFQWKNILPLGAITNVGHQRKDVPGGEEEEEKKDGSSSLDIIS